MLQAVETPKGIACLFDGCVSGRRIYAYLQNDPLNAADPNGSFANAGARLTAGLQGKGGFGSIVQASANENAIRYAASKTIGGLSRASPNLHPFV